MNERMNDRKANKVLECQPIGGSQSTNQSLERVISHLGIG